ncbi:penicillin-binding transpeptidase domain-containing protein, partial [Anaerosporobacter sp.]|uniref:penicillin-binding transpeptidase domain-containing protein n=1 Tax=Anaerosporobacter sp. TaxID=1872529 RepID=UPI00286EFAF1
YNHEGKLLIDNSPTTSQVMKESTAFLLTNAMQDVVKIGTAASYISLGSMPVAGKTGTTTDSKDLWFVGYTPYYTGGIWGGYDNNNGDQNGINTSYHKRLWNLIMNQIHEGYKKKNFTKPDSIVTATICTKSGKLAKEGVCEHAPGGSTVKTEYFAKGTVPTEVCDCHVKLRICKSSGLQASEHCPENAVTEKVFLIKEETGATKDTPYLLPSSIEDSICNVHSAGEIIDVKPDKPKNDDSVPNTNDDPDDDEDDDDVIPPIPDVNIPTTPDPNDDENNSGE